MVLPRRASFFTSSSKSCQSGVRIESISLCVAHRRRTSSCEETQTPRIAARETPSNGTLHPAGFERAEAEITGNEWGYDQAKNQVRARDDREAGPSLEGGPDSDDAVMSCLWHIGLVRRVVFFPDGSRMNVTRALPATLQA